MKIANFILAGLVHGQEGSGEETEVFTATFGVTMGVNNGKDLSLAINQMDFENTLNEEDGDNVIFSELTFTANPSAGGGVHDAMDFTVDATASVTAETTDTIEEFAAKAKAAVQAEASENADSTNVEEESVGAMSCTDGANGGCSHFCTDNKCSCPTCWGLEADLKKCSPTDGLVSITCGEEQMTLSISECVIEDNSGFELLDSSCAPTLDNGIWSVSTDLDSCGTTLELDADSQMVTFTNQLHAAPEIKNGLIMSRSLAMEFECQYGTTYDDVSNNRTVIGGHIITSATSQKGTFGKGSLGFSLNFYTDSKFDSLVDPESMIMVGETLFFSIESTTTINGLVFTVLDCTVSDPTLGAEYDILTDQCADPFVGTTIGALSDAAMLEYSYTAFQFAGTIGSETQEKLSCSVLVCDSTAASGPCLDTPTCGGRRKRAADEGQLFYVSQTFTLGK